MPIAAKAKKLGHRVYVAGRGKDWVTYQCDKCWMLATREGGREFGPLITRKCPGLQPYAKSYKKNWGKGNK